MKVFKDTAGRWRWVTLSSTAYRVADDNIISTQALADDVARADRDGAYGPLRWWHMPGIDIGDCDFNAMHGRTLIESGTFRDEVTGAALAEHADELGASIAFDFKDGAPDADGVFHWIRRLERSLLPAAEAADPYTGVMVMTTKDAGSPMDQQKLDALRALGVDPDPLIAKARANEARALLDGVDFKSVQLKDAPAWPEGVLFGDLTIDEASAWWAASITGPLLEQINALAAGAPMPTTKAFGPKTSPADPLDADLERVRQSVVEASQRLGDSQIGKELQAFAQRLQQLAGIQAPTAAGTLQDDQAPLPTTKAADAPHLFDPVPAQKGGGLGDIFAGAFGHRNGRN